MSLSSKAIVLDRDGVINFDSDDYIKSPCEWKAIPGSIEAIAKLSNSGYRVFIATNQSGLARDYFKKDTLDEIHAKMLQAVNNVGGEIAGVFYCPHHPDENCDCRKPKPGLLEQIENVTRIKLEGCYFVGDSIKDLECATAKNCRPILVRTGKGKLSEKELLRQSVENDFLIKQVQVFSDLASFVNMIIK